MIDPENGTDAKVAYCLRRFDKIEDAIEELRIREGTAAENIGYLCGENGRNNCRDDNTLEKIKSWATDPHIDVVWTDSRGNFQAKLGHPFSVAAACEHLQSLDPVARAKALEYIRRAPPFVQTPLRHELAQGIGNG